MSEIEVVRASKAAKRHSLFHRLVSGSRSSLPSAFILEDSQKLAKRAVLSVRRGPIRYRRNSTIVCEGDPADYVFMAVDGVVRRCKTFQNGARAIVAFHTPGELFGWTDEVKHALSIEAATDALILFFKRSVLLSVAAREQKVSEFLLTSTTGELRRIQEHSLLINRRRFLLHPRGVAFDRTGGTDVVGVSPTNTELEDAAKWTMVYEAKNVRIVGIEHNN